MSQVVGAYVCPRGVFGVECRRRSSGLEVLRSFDVPVQIASATEGAGHLNRVLAQAGIRRAEIALAVRGFDVVHHLLAFPPAADSILASIVDREIRRLEPQIVDPVIAWLRLTPEAAADGDPATQPQLLVAAIPREVADAFAGAIRSAGHSLLHLTALPVAYHRLAEEFVSPTEAMALVAQLPDGPYLGFSLAGAVRLVIEPPLRPEDALPDAAALAEEVELGAMFVRQQFRGAQIARATVVVQDDAYAEVEAALGARLGVPVGRLAVHNLSAGALAGFGAILDSRASQSASLAGRTGRRAEQGAPALKLAATVTIVLAALVGLWALSGALNAGNAARALQIARRQIDQEAYGITPLRETAGRRKLIADAVATMQVVARDRAALQRGLTSLASSVPGPVRLDSILIERGVDGWNATMGGTVLGQTNGQAVQALNDFYRDLPRNAQIQSLALQQLVYADTIGGALVHFQVSFGLPGRKTN